MKKESEKSVEKLFDAIVSFVVVAGSIFAFNSAKDKISNNKSLNETKTPKDVKDIKFY